MNTINISQLYHIVVGDEFQYIQPSPCKNIKTPDRIKYDEYITLTDDAITQNILLLDGIPVFNKCKKQLYTKLKAFVANKLLATEEDDYLYIVNGDVKKLSRDDINFFKSYLPRIIKRYIAIQDLSQQLSMDEILEHSKYATYLIPKDMNSQYINQFVNRYSGITKGQAMDWAPRSIDNLNEDTVGSLTKNPRVRQFIINSLRLEQDPGIKLYPIPEIPDEFRGRKIIMLDIEYINTSQTTEIICISMTQGNTHISITNDGDDELIHKVTHFISYYTNPIIMHWGHADRSVISKKFPNTIEDSMFDLLKFLKDRSTAFKGCYNYALKQVHKGMFGTNLNKDSGCQSGSDALSMYNGLNPDSPDYQEKRKDVLNMIARYNINDCLMVQDIWDYIRNNQ